MNGGERLHGLEGLRGYAAFLVFLVHAFGYLGARLFHFADERALWPDVHGPAQAITAWLFHSHYGVDLFFVLSGFLMADLALGRWPGARRFLVRRWLRIYPAYALSTLVAGTAAYAWLGHSLGGTDLAGNALVLQGFFVLGLVAANPVSWSLSYEVAFYLAVPLFARLRGGKRPSARLAWFAPLVALYVLLVVAAAIAPSEKAIYFAYFALFLPGVAVGALEPATRRAISGRVPLALGVAAWIAFTAAFKLELFSNRDAAYYPLSSLACTLVLLKAADARSGLARALATRVPRIMGRYSYSFFLIHYIVLQVFGAVLARAAPSLTPGVYAFVFLSGGFLLAFGAAWLLYTLTERFYFRPAKGPAATPPAMAGDPRPPAATRTSR